MKISGIYQIQSTVHPERIYIGSAVDIDARRRQHLNRLIRDTHHSQKLQRHFNKYGEQDFQFTVLETCIKELLIQHEQHYIDILNPYFNGCKIAGSLLGFRHTKETRQKYSKAKKGHIPWNKGKKASDGLRLKLSKSHIGNTSRLGKGLGSIPWNKGLRGVQEAWNKGISPSVEIRQKQSMAIIEWWVKRKLKAA